jgi:hypothetical protein
MKKFLLSSALMLLITGAFAQSVCPTNAKRNNGNACTNGGTGGGIEVEFPSAPNPQLQIALIVSTQGTATVIEQTKVVSTRAGKTFIDWCFETDNIGPVVQGSVTYRFYLDLNNNFQQDFDPNNPTAPGSEPSFVCSQATLPVSLKNFDAAKRTNKVSITWETESEINNDGFEIQRRTGNGTYKTIAFVDSKAPGGNSAGNISYTFDDNENLPNGVAYYRLRQVDLDGKSIYSEIKAVRSNSKALFISVYPNPSRGTTNVAIPEGAGVVDIALEDFTGKLVQRWSGLNTRNLQLTNLNPGMYMLRVNARESGEQVVERILIQ